MTLCNCKPREYGEDRTHTVRYRQAFYEEGRVVSEDGGTLDISCTHNDAVAIADMMAGYTRWHTGLKPRGRQGTWRGSDVFEGDGVTEDIFIYRGPAEEDYDSNRAKEAVR